jgi:hypothetical protein
VISEAIRRLTGKRRGRYMALVACVAIAVGAVGFLVVPALPYLFAGVPGVLGRYIFNIGFWVFLALALSTTYARLRA